MDNPFAGGPQPSFDEQSNENGIWTGVKAGFHADTQEEVSDFLVIDKSIGEGIHLGINDMGEEVFNQPHFDQPPQ